jgi:hypothetical protein
MKDEGPIKSDRFERQPPDSTSGGLKVAKVAKEENLTRWSPVDR